MPQFCVLSTATRGQKTHSRIVPPVSTPASIQPPNDELYCPRLVKSSISISTGTFQWARTTAGTMPDSQGKICECVGRLAKLPSSGSQVAPRLTEVAGSCPMLPYWICGFLNETNGKPL